MSINASVLSAQGVDFGVITDDVYTRRGGFTVTEEGNQTKYTYEGADGQTSIHLGAKAGQSLQLALGSPTEDTHAATKSYVDSLQTAVAGDGLEGGAGSALSVRVDNATVEIASDAVRVKDAGIVAAKLADGAVTHEKLSLSQLGVGATGGEFAVGGGGDVTCGNITAGSGSGGIVINGSGSITGADITIGVDGGTSQNLTVTGDVVANSLTSTSDATLKTGIVNLDDAESLLTVLRMRPKSYAFKSAPGVSRRGVLAQDLEHVAPHLVVRNGSHLAVNYVDMVAHLIGAIRRQQVQIDALTVALGGRRHE